jgi:hypothetical protein
MRVLWQAWANGTPEVTQETLLAAANTAQDRVDQVFRIRNGMHPAWGTLIISPQRGTYQLQPPTNPTEFPSSAPQS